MYRPWASPESPRMFESDLVDAFSRTHWAFVPIAFVPATCWLVWKSLTTGGQSLAATVGLFLAGVVVWTLTEYWLHRTLFHWVPDHPWGKKMHWMIHGVHHDWPNDKYRLVLPPLASVPLFFLFLGVWVGLFGNAGWGFMAGFVFGYIVYDLTHYYLHHSHPKLRWVRKLQGHHASHHFNKRYMEKRFGVSSPLWDYVFGTRE